MIQPKERADERKAKGYSDDGPSTQFLQTTGKFTMAVAGWEYFSSAVKGTAGLMIRFVVVEGEHAGEVRDRDFYLTQNALFMLADLALAFGYEEPFDERSDDDIDKVVSHGLGVCTVTVKAEGYQKNDGSSGTKYEPRFFARYKGAAKDTWQEHIDAGIKSFNGYLKWRENNPRATPGQQRMGGQTPVAEGEYVGNPSTGEFNSDEIPF